MSGASWAVRIAPAQSAPAASLRLTPGVEVCASDESVWLRGAGGSEALDRELRMLPGAERFEVGRTGEIRRVGERVPTGKLPAGPWVAAAAWAIPAVPAVNPAGFVTQRVPVRVERADAERPANVVRLPMSLFASWAIEAPAARLKRLQFAASKDDVVVRGSPLPPLPGALFAESEGIAIPVGYRLSPDIGAALWRERLRLLEGDIALFATDSTWERVPGTAFVRATRAAVRGTVSGA